MVCRCFPSREYLLFLILGGSGTRSIPNTIVKSGGGKGWMLSPIPMPNFVGSVCDTGSGHPCKSGCGFSLNNTCGTYPGGNTPEVLDIPCIFLFLVHILYRTSPKIKSPSRKIHTFRKGVCIRGFVSQFAGFSFC